MPRMTLTLSGTVVALGLSLAGCGLGGPAHGPPSDVAATVRMSGFDFEPRQVRIKRGEVVEWRNTSIISHTVTDDPRTDPTLTALPAGASAFDSGPIRAGQIFRHTFMVPGTYRYKCEPHADMDMTGVVVVEDRT